MNNNRSGEEGLFLVGVIVVGAMVYSVLSWMAHLLGLDIPTTFKVLGGSLLFIGGAICGRIWLPVEWFSRVLSVTVLLLWLVWWSALDYWGTHEKSTSSEQVSSETKAFDDMINSEGWGEPKWYASGWFKGAGVVCILIGGCWLSFSSRSPFNRDKFY